MAALSKASFISPREYLAIEREAEAKSEYIDGEMYAMAGASFAHNRIVANLIRSLGNRLEGGPCVVLASDMRVGIPSRSLYTYPDVVVVCGRPEFEDDGLDTLTNPTVLIEVLSRSTEGYDRGRKAAEYRKIPSLAAYVFVSQDMPKLEVYHRHAERLWLLSEASSLEETLSVAPLGGPLVLSEIYSGIELP